MKDYVKIELILYDQKWVITKFNSDKNINIKGMMIEYCHTTESYTKITLTNQVNIEDEEKIIPRIKTLLKQKALDLLKKEILKYNNEKNYLKTERLQKELKKVCNMKVDENV